MVGISLTYYLKRNHFKYFGVDIIFRLYSPASYRAYYTLVRGPDFYTFKSKMCDSR